MEEKILNECGRRYRINARAVVYHEGKILAVRHRDKRTGKAVDHWATPGGGVEVGEEIAAAMTREIMEEFGVEAKAERLLFCMQWFNRQKQTEMIDFFFLVQSAEAFLDGEPGEMVKSPDEIADARFIDLREGCLLPEFFAQVDLKDICENVHEVRMFSYL